MCFCREIFSSVIVVIVVLSDAVSYTALTVIVVPSSVVVAAGAEESPSTVCVCSSLVVRSGRSLSLTDVMFLYDTLVPDGLNTTHTRIIDFAGSVIVFVVSVSFVFDPQ